MNEFGVSHTTIRLSLKFVNNKPDCKKIRLRAKEYLLRGSKKNIHTIDIRDLYKLSHFFLEHKLKPL